MAVPSFLEFMFLKKERQFLVFMVIRWTFNELYSKSLFPLKFFQLIQYSWIKCFFIKEGSRILFGLISVISWRIGTTVHISVSLLLTPIILTENTEEKWGDCLRLEKCIVTLHCGICTIQYFSQFWMYVHVCMCAYAYS